MVAVSNRQRLLQNLERYIVQEAVSADDTEDEENIDDLLDFYSIIQQSRYLERGLSHDEKRRRLYAEGFRRCMSQNDLDFARDLRVTKVEFQLIASLISTHPILLSTGRKPQAPAHIQLAVVLWRLTHHGDGSSAFQVGRLWGISGESPLHSSLTSKSSLIYRGVCMPLDRQDSSSPAVSGVPCDLLAQ